VVTLQEVSFNGKGPRLNDQRFEGDEDIVHSLPFALLDVSYIYDKGTDSCVLFALCISVFTRNVKVRVQKV
jgi:hypothetical protein